MDFRGRGILLDVEGTTSAVAYVYDVMFPFARTGLASYLDTHWESPALAEVRQQVAADADTPDAENDRATFEAEVVRMMDGDAKATGLKHLQGLIWEAGFESGELIAHVYDDVPPALHRWQQAGIDLRIYSSGSVHAQQLFFAHTVAGDLLHFFTGHYDTKIGGKREATSYTHVTDDWGLAPGEILFLSDVVAELDAAREAGMQTALCLRPGNAEVDDKNGHAACPSFAEISILR